MAEGNARDYFLEGNEMLEKAIKRYHADSNRENLIAVLDAVRRRMHADGHLLFPIIRDEGDAGRFVFRSVMSGDGRQWNAAFTSWKEFEKGAESEVVSNFIDSMLKNSLKTKTAGIMINPWGQPFLLANELIGMIFRADGGLEYTVPDEEPTEEQLEDGSFLKKALEICNRNRTRLNLLKLLQILKKSRIWVPCEAVLGEEDYEAWSRAVHDAAEKGDLDSLVGQEFISHDSIRLAPDILKHGDDSFFPVFTAEEEMGEYGEGFSRVQKPFMEAATLACNDKDVKGIVINAFSEAFVIPKDTLEQILIDSLKDE